MLNIRSILTPIDFSDRTKVAAQEAVELARHFGAKLFFLHVVPTPPTEYANFSYQGAECLGETEAYCTELLSDWVNTLVGPELECEKLVLGGDPAKEISQFAHSQDMGLIVMPTRSQGAYRRFLPGSNTAKVLHDVRVPVLTGAHREGPQWKHAGYRRVACFVDWRESSEIMLRFASEFANSYGAELAVVHGVPQFLTHADVIGDEYGSSLKASVRLRLEEVVERMGAKARIFVETTDLATAAQTLAAKEGFDLFVIGRSLPAGGANLSTDACTLICASACPVLSV